MRLIADENFPLPTIEALRQAGHDATWARTDCPGTKDAALLDRAEAEGRILLTLDKDFWPIALQRRRRECPPLVLRTVGADEEWGGHSSVVTEERVLMVRSGNPPELRKREGVIHGRRFHRVV